MTELNRSDVAFLLNVAAEQIEGKPRTIVSAHRLFAYANRNADQPLDFEVERILRADPKMRALYLQAKAKQSIAFSELAAAASSDTFPRREIGAFELNVFQDEDHVFVVLKRMNDDDTKLEMPKEIEIRNENGEGGSIILPDPVDGKQVIALSLGDEDHDMFIEALKQVKTHLFLK